MGYMRHHAIIVTATDERATRAHAKAVELCGDLVSPLISGRINGYSTLLVAADGSKEGWYHSDEAEAQRAAFVAWLRAQEYEDGSSSYDWALVQYGDDEDWNYVADASGAGWAERMAQSKVAP